MYLSTPWALPHSNLYGNHRVVDLLVLLEAECLHEDNERNLTRRGRDRHDQHPVLLHLHERERSVPLALREHFRNGDLPAIPLVVLHENTIRREILERDQRRLRPADDEVTPGVERVLAHFDQFQAVLRLRELSVA